GLPRRRRPLRHLRQRRGAARRDRHALSEREPRLGRGVPGPMRWTGTGLFVAGMVAAFYVVPDSWPLRYETAWTVTIVGLYVLTGALVGRWWALLLVFV